jgi:hypothetical protein
MPNASHRTCGDLTTTNTMYFITIILYIKVIQINVRLFSQDHLPKGNKNV